MACMTFLDLTGSGSLNILPSAVGIICQDTPNWSVTQPHRCFSPPAESFSHNPSTSVCVSQFTKNEMAGENLKCGPPLRAINFCPSSSKVPVMTVPLGPAPLSVARNTYDF